jgi:CheY-like chemotaxis protein
METKSNTLERTPLVTRNSALETRKGLRILVADDNRVNQRLVLRLLEKLGHSIVLANNGREAVDLLDRAVFDVVLMDIQMPELGGFEATAVIRQTEKRTGVHVPIYALTAYAMKGDRERCLEAGMDGYLSKPIQSQELYKLLDTVERLSGARDNEFGSILTPKQVVRTIAASRSGASVEPARSVPGAVPRCGPPATDI